MAAATNAEPTKSPNLAQKTAATPMLQLTAMVEQAEDSTWTAAVIGDHSVLGTGASKEEAIADLRRVDGLVNYLKLKGEALPQPSIELVSIEVAA